MPQHYADAICVPLVHEGTTLGAIHVYLEKGRFKQTDFDVAIPLANILTVALVRARREDDAARSSRSAWPTRPPSPTS